MRRGRAPKLLRKFTSHKSVLTYKFRWSQCVVDIGVRYFFCDERASEFSEPCSSTQGGGGQKTVKMAVQGFSETLVRVYRATQRHIPEERNVYTVLITSNVTRNPPD
jgi:hypothetical protein